MDKFCGMTIITMVKACAACLNGDLPLGNGRLRADKLPLWLRLSPVVNGRELAKVLPIVRKKFTLAFWLALAALKIIK